MIVMNKCGIEPKDMTTGMRTERVPCVHLDTTLEWSSRPSVHLLESMDRVCVHVCVYILLYMPCEC